MKLNSLQILRAFAAISVLFTHVFQRTNYKPVGDYLLSGQYGVDLFFILSGFLIYLTVKESTSTLQCVRKRVFRIYPLYILHILIIKIFMQYFNVENTLILLLLTLSTTIFMSSITYRWIEKPFINLSSNNYRFSFSKQK